jgi:hypothetical protein
MTGTTDPWHELGVLAAALCDGEITRDEAARLEKLVRRSAEARSYLVRYVQLHGELCWERAASAERAVPAETCAAPVTACPAPELSARGFAALRARRAVVWGSALAVTAAAVLVVLAATFTGGRTPVAREASAPRLMVARVRRTFEARWADGQTRPEGCAVLSGQELTLLDGVAEIVFNSGAEVILQGPATIEALTSARSLFHRGSATCRLAGSSRGFVAETPEATVIDRGTEFGLLVSGAGATDVHVFSGRVEVHPPPGHRGDHRPRTVEAGQAVQVAGKADGPAWRISEIGLGDSRLVRSFPVRGTVARLRAVARRHPDLIHHYTFEGHNSGERRRDKAGFHDLLDVVMYGGSGEGTVHDAAAGFDSSTMCVETFRLDAARGVGLGTDLLFEPPDELTVELLLRFDGFRHLEEQEPAVAVATRSDDRDCAFFVAVAGAGRLVHLMDGGADWVEADAELLPGHWYYLASTFRVRRGQTVVNSYLADLTRQDTQLRRVVGDVSTVGTPATSRLGIGKGFGSDISHAYPWPGALDEVAIYRRALDYDTLVQHFRSLIHGP